jgi:hypothetical protein
VGKAVKACRPISRDGSASDSLLTHELAAFEKMLKDGGFVQESTIGGQSISA